MNENHLIVILGPTASGKTSLAVALANEINGEILSGDSRQVYRGMDIGTGKDLEEYQIDGKPIPYHLIDIAEAGEALHINDYFDTFRTSLAEVVSRQKTPILCGGSGLYLEMAIEGNELAQIPVNSALREELQSMDKSALQKLYDGIRNDLKAKLDNSTSKRMIRAIEINQTLAGAPLPDSRKLDMPYTVFGLDPEVRVRRDRISTRLHQRLEEGMIEEVEDLLAQGISPAKLEYYGLEYKWISMHLRGEVSREKMVTKLETAIHQFAKRQMTWFRRMEKKGWKIHWLEGRSTEEYLNNVLAQL